MTIDQRSAAAPEQPKDPHRPTSRDVAGVMKRLLVRLSTRYCWDRNSADAAREADRVMLRTMDVGVWEDLLELEATAGRERLRQALSSCPAGGLTPRSWSFWHYRLGLAEARRGPPPMPSRRTG